METTGSKKYKCKKGVTLSPSSTTCHFKYSSIHTSSRHALHDHEGAQWPGLRAWRFICRALTYPH